jgi:4-amino-4-deoxy-L-arabinose transferase-like glycosyltransferase
MTEAGIPARERAVYAAGFLIAAALLYATHFTSHDGDSALYAGIAHYTSAEPMRDWIAPKWWGLWEGSQVDELFVEHPAGLFWIPAALGRLGLDGGPSSYVVGIAAGLGSLLLLASLVERIAGAAAARAVRLLAPLMPVAFVFRVRANHEYPMLFFLLLALLALERVRQRARWWPPVAIAFAGALVVKGVFALLVIGAAGLWLLLAPSNDARNRSRAWAAFAAAVVVTIAVALGYDDWYASVTGHPFWITYWARQVGPMTFASPLEQMGVILKHLRFYGLHVLWYSAPWTLVLAWCGFNAWRAHGRSSAATASTGETRALTFALLFAAASLIALSIPSRVAERYAFSAGMIIGAAGIVSSMHMWPAWRRWIERVDASVPALPALVWAALLIGRIALAV